MIENNLLECLMMQDGNGFIDRRELGLMLKFSGEVFSQAEIEVGLSLSLFLSLSLLLSLSLYLSFSLSFVCSSSVGRSSHKQRLRLTFQAIHFNSVKGWPTYHLEIINGADLDLDGDFNRPTIQFNSVQDDQFITRRLSTGRTWMEMGASIILSLLSWWWTALSDILME